MTKEEFIEIIAKENNILISKDDPILILFTANHYLLKEFNENLLKVFDEHRSLLELTISEYDEITKKYAEQSLNAALAASKKTLTKHVEESSTEISELIKKEILAAKINLEDERKKINTYSMVNLVLLIFVIFLIFLNILIK